MRFLILPLMILAGCAQPPRSPAPDSAQAPAGLVTVDYKMTEVNIVLSEIARQSGRNLVFRGSNPLVTVTLTNIPWRDALLAVAATCDLEVSWETPGIACITSR